MALDVGLNFRSTSGYVTEASNEIYVLGETSSTTRTSSSGVSVTFQWTTGTPTALDRDTTHRRLAGMNYSGVGGGEKIFTIDLSSVTGYDGASALDVYAAHGDPLAGWTPVVDYRDNATSFGGFTQATGGANRFDDATGVAQTSQANWIANASGDSGGNKVSRTFSSSSFRVSVGAGSVDLSMLTHLRLMQSGAAAAAAGPLFDHYFKNMRGMG
jgi:hypothetical protein